MATANSGMGVRAGDTSAPGARGQRPATTVSRSGLEGSDAAGRRTRVVDAAGKSHSTAIEFGAFTVQ